MVFEVTEVMMFTIAIDTMAMREDCNKGGDDYDGTDGNYVGHGGHGGDDGHGGHGGD